MGRKNRNVLERIEGEEVSVTRNDVGGAATYSKFEELVVLGVPASCYPLAHIDPVSLARESGEETSNVFLIDVPAKALSAQYFVEFREGWKRKQEFSLFDREIKSLARLRVGQEQRADKDVCIEDAAQQCGGQLGALEERIQNLWCESPVLGLASDLVEHLL